MRATVAWCLFVLGLICVVVDLVMPPIWPTGVGLAGIVLLLVWLVLIGGFRRSFWIADEDLSRHLDAVDIDVDARTERSLTRR